MEGGMRNSWEAANCFVVVQTNKSGMMYTGIELPVSKELKEDLITASRKSDRVMSIELGLEEMVLHKWVLNRTKKKRFGNIIIMDHELNATQDGVSVIVGGYLN